jgi:hypothetical protein
MTNLTMDTTGKLCLGGTFGIVSTWSAADVAAQPPLTLSNGGLTVSSTGSGWRTVRNTTSKTSGKLYIEISIDSTDFWSGQMFGFANASFDVSPINTYLGSANYSVGLQTQSGGFGSSGFTVNYSGLPNGEVGSTWGLAIDFAAGKIWIAFRGTWVNSSDPAAGTLPIVSFVPATVGALYAAASTSSIQVLTIHSIAASQMYAAPSGFKAWDAP